MGKRNHHTRSSANASPWVGRVTCPECGKQGFWTRKLAKRAARSLYPGQQLSVYQCQRGSDLWHFGHLHYRVKQGARSREEYGAAAFRRTGLSAHLDTRRRPPGT